MSSDEQFLIDFLNWSSKSTIDQWDFHPRIEPMLNSNDGNPMCYYLSTSVQALTIRNLAQNFPLLKYRKNITKFIYTGWRSERYASNSPWHYIGRQRNHDVFKMTEFNIRTHLNGKIDCLIRRPNSKYKIFQLLWISLKY